MAVEQQSHDARGACIFRRFCMLTLALALSLASHCVVFAARDGMSSPSTDLAFVNPFSSRTRSFSRDTRGWFGVAKPSVAKTGGALGSGSCYGETSRSSLVEQDTTLGKRTRVPSRSSITRPASSRSGITMSAENAGGPKIIIAGAPASGKGTQCSLIKERYGVVHLSTGDMLREAVKNETPVGVKAKSFMDEGKLVPDDVIIDIVRNRLEKEDCQTRGWLLDGFPRTRAQADALAAAGIKADSFLLLNVPDEMLIARVVGRRLDPETGDIYHLDFNPPPPEIADRLIQRADDTAEKAQVRLDTYHNNIVAIKECYEDIIRSLDGSVGKTEVFEKITEELDSKLAQSGEVVEKETEPIEGMKPGTSGLRKKA